MKIEIFRGHRIALQSPKMPQLMSGWITRAEGTVIEVTLNAPASVAKDDTLIGSVIYQQVNAQFRCKVCKLEDMVLEVTIDSRINMAETEADSRLRTNLEQTMILDGEQILVNVKDVSIHGLGILAPVPLNKGQAVEVLLDIEGNEVRLPCVAKYVEKESDTSINFRIGLRISTIDRLTRARWNAFLASNDPELFGLAQPAA